MKAALSLTHRCNLSCKYCYSGRSFKKDMSLVTAQKIVDFIMDIAPHEQRIDFSFFGGEPLLRFDLIKEIVDYIHVKEQNTGKPVSLSITTNGTLLTQTILDFFIEENIDLCLSIDGPRHVHNLNRCYKGGRGSFNDVLKILGMVIKQLDNVQVNTVFGPDTIEFLLESVTFFIRFGVSVIHLNPNICASWTESTYSKFEDIYAKIAHHYIQSYEYGQEIAINLIDSKIIVLLKGGYDITDKCGMGQTEFGFAPSGNIYPCERLIGEDNNSATCLGNIHTGIEPMRCCSLLKHRGNHNEECKTCDLLKFCMNWCGCTNYYMTGHTDLTGPMICESEKAAIQAARHVLVALNNNELFLDHFMKYLIEGRHCRQKGARL